MNFEEYRDGRIELYRKFSDVVAKILDSALADQLDKLNLWQTQQRAKTADSLEKKLASRKLLDNNAIENAIKDLAGCRVIFYSNDDVDYLLQSGIINENFDVDWEQSKLHHSRDDRLFAILFSLCAFSLAEG